MSKAKAGKPMNPEAVLEYCGLDNIEAEILRLRFGIDVVKSLTRPVMSFDEIADCLGRTASEIEAIEGTALRKIRTHKTKKILVEQTNTIH